MLTRRDMVLGGALALIWHGSGCACAQARPRGRTGFGCMLDAAEAEPFLATATAPQAFDRFQDHRQETLVASSGDRDVDHALARILSQVTDVFGVLPGFSFYDDYDGPNAFATNAVRLQRADGTVLYGKRYLSKGLAAEESPEAVITATCAHEFGHIVQWKYNLDGLLKRGQSTVKRLELHADFLAGYFAGTRKLQQPDYPAAVFATNRYARGDFDHGTQHHGTPQERAAAVVRGFETAYRERRSFADAVQIGTTYALSL